tara:strand:- start:607 stop:951 length:345 start_codon:yes stop_codon:yes gene_type:complete
MENQNNEIKFNEEDLEKIKIFQQRYVEIQMGFGQAEINRARLESQLKSVDEFVDNLKQNLDSIQEEERTFIQDVNKKYGDGVLNPATGVFTPNSSAENKEQELPTAPISQQATS